MAKKRQMKIGVFIASAGQHIAAWRHPRAQADGSMNVSYLTKLAQTAERGKLDLLFLADSLSIDEKSHPNILTRFEPLTLLSVLSQVTEKIGLAATASTTYEEPYHLARKFASLDHLSNGRAAWNIVTTSDDQTGFNFSKDAHMEHGQRYEKATEFVNVVKGLWNSWEENAFVRDKQTGTFIKPESLNELNHKDTYFKVRGPLNIDRSPQTYPVFIQAGSSDAGQNLAANTADIVFTAQSNIDDAKRFYQSVKQKIGSAGRNPDDVFVMPGFFPIIGKTKQEAEAKFRELQDLILPDVGLAILSDFLCGIDFSQYPLDGPVPDLNEFSTNQVKSRFELIKELAIRESLSIRELYEHVAASRGHYIFIGTAEQLASEMKKWFTEGASDGFNILPPLLPDSLNDFVDEVIPILQREGLFKEAYQGKTLREMLGLKSI